ncbi:MAG: YpdA family putative bacillithiol disulfide reductase [candidate division KSB1 bacterium]|jgi:putative YpdA family bacillithiol system oxidoreductase|nr:YpdA family putative bacillithiol disulfide reductase [candidate division KSB1 bacterium]
MKENQFDIAIVGGGPIGLACAIEAERAGFSNIIIEKGCLVNSVFNYPTNMTFFSTSDRLEIGDVPFISHGDKPTRREALEYFRRVVDAWKLNVKTYETVNDVVKSQDGFEVRTDKATYQSRYVIIATGFYDLENLLNIPGEDLPKVHHYFKEAHPFTFQKVIVVGAANSAVDAALETYRRGADVTLVVRESEIQPGVKYWVRPDIVNRIDEGSIKAYFNSEIREIREKDVDVHTPDGIITLENDFILAMTGYHPDFDFLKKIGIDLAEDNTCLPSYDPFTHETNVSGLFMAGVVCGGMETNKWTIENSREHASRIFRYLKKK